MRKLIIVSSFFLFIKCFGQNNDFNQYINEFTKVALPVKVEPSNYASLFYPDGNYKEIPPIFIKNYICLDTIKCDLSGENYRFDYGIRIDLYQNKFYTIIVHKQNFESDIPFEYDLSETLILTYTKEGQIISKVLMGKDNDNYISNLEIFNDKIVVQQIKLIGINGEEYPCEIQLKEFKVNDNGKIENTETFDLKKGTVILDEKTGYFKLKE